MPLTEVQKRDKKDLFIEERVRKHLANKIEFYHIVRDIALNKTVQQMKKYKQHCNVSCYQHCLYVAYFTYLICKKLHLDYVSAARAAMLHDLFLYDWREKHRDAEFSSLHAFAHPKIALRNASKLFDLNDKQKDIIVKHMWPLTIVFPRYAESYIITLTDKYSAMYESYQYIYSRYIRKKPYTY